MLGHQAERIYQSLRKSVLTGAWPVNSRLPTERELCTQFDASRETIRKAVRQLHEDRFIEIHPNRGAYVRNIPDTAQARNLVSLMFCGTGERLTLIQDQLLIRGCTLVLYSQIRTRWDVRREAEFLEQVRQQRHLALLAFCSPLQPGNDALLEQIVAAGTRVVHIEPYSVELPRQEFFMPDYGRAGYAAAARLIAKGFASVHYVGIQNDGPVFRQIRAGVLAAVRDLLDPNRNDSDVFIPTPFDPSPANLRRMGRLLPADGGLVCGSLERTLTMRKAYQVAHETGLDAMRLVAIEQPMSAAGERIGCDSYVFDREAALSRLMDGIVRPEAPAIRELIPPRLVVAPATNADSAGPKRLSRKRSPVS